MGIAIVQVATAGTASGGAVNATWPVATTAGNTLIAFYSCFGGYNASPNAPAGWSRIDAEDNGAAIAEAVFIYPNAPAQTTSGNFSGSAPALLICIELSGVSRTIPGNIAYAIATSATVNSGNLTVGAPAPGLPYMILAGWSTTVATTASSYGGSPSAPTAIAGAFSSVSGLTMQVAQWPGLTTAGTWSGTVTFADSAANIGMIVQLLGAPPTATFVQRDNWRNGATWMSTYGLQGYSILQLGGVADVALAGWSWTDAGGNYLSPWIGPDAATAADPRYLQVPGQPGIAGISAYYNTTSYTITLDLDDGLAHSVAFFLLDHDNSGRNGTITAYDVTDPANPIALDAARTIGDHATTAVYMVWNIAGKVQFNHVNTGGSNLVTSAWFVDRPKSIGTLAHGTSTNVLGTLVSYWKLDEAATGATAIDSSPLGANATDGYGTTAPATTAPVHAPTSFTNPTGRHFSQNNSLDAGVQAPHSFTQNFTVSAWVRVGNTDGGIVGHMNAALTQGWALRMTSSNSVNFQTANAGGIGNFLSDVELPSDVWAHVVGICYSASAYIFVNGHQQSGSASVIPDPSPTLNTYLGRDWNGATYNQLYCDLDDVRLYNVALTNDQISSLAAGNDPLLVTTATRAHGTSTNIAPVSAIFVQRDFWRNGGPWWLTYGLQGYSIFQLGGVADVLPPSCSVSWTNGVSLSPWQGPSVGYFTDLRYLQIPGQSGFAGSATYYNNGTNPVYAEFDFNDGLTHSVALYFADPDGQGRDANITAYDFTNPASPIPIDAARAVGPNFVTGVYLVWNLTGHVRFTIAVTGSFGQITPLAWFIDRPKSVGARTHGADSYIRYATAGFVQRDNWRNGGHWIGTYGTQGWSLIGLAGTADHPPPRCSWSDGGGAYSGWFGSSASFAANPIFLQVPGQPGIAGAFATYNTDPATPYYVAFNLDDSRSHSLALYFLDPDPAGRLGNVTACDNSDPANPVAIDAVRAVGDNATTGVYLVWNVTGRVRFNIVATGPVGSEQIVMSAWFIDRPRAIGARAHGTDTGIARATAVFVQRDNWRNGGTWMSTYGFQGYGIMQLDGVADNPPVNCSVIYAGGTLTGGWYPASAANAADPRYLQVPGQPGIAGAEAYYVGDNNYDLTYTITFDLDDGLPHSLALYFLDPERGGRVGTVTASDVTNPANPIAIDVTRDIGDFATTGVYMVWNLTGHVQFTMACSAGANTTTVGWFVDRPRSVGARAHGTSSFVWAVTATWVQRDHWRGGLTWINLYGTQGYGLFGLSGVADNPPAGCTITFANGTLASPWWGPTAGLSTDLRALQIPGQPGIAGLCGYFSATSYTATFDLADDLPHSVSLYYGDADPLGRNGDITAYDITDAANPVALDVARTIGDHSVIGVYMVWNVTGRVQFNIVLTADTNLVTAAWFIDRPRTVGTLTHGADSYMRPATAAFIQKDTWRWGSWINTYGAQGYSLFNMASTPDVLPPSCSVAWAGGSQLDWLPAGPSADPFLLQVPGQPGVEGLSIYYGFDPFTGTFTIDDGLAHSVAFYFLDVSRSSRNGTITAYDVTDSANPVQLDVPRTVGYHNDGTNGTYMVWNVSGHVQFTFTMTEGPNLTVGGWFVDRPKSVGTRVHGASSYIWAATATWVQRDNWRNAGPWWNTYGAQGYSIFQLGGTPDVLPAGCSVSWTNGVFLSPWQGPNASFFADLRCPQIPGQPGIAGLATYYCVNASTPFYAEFDLNDGLPHSVALYYLDPDGTGRTADITAYDVTNPANPIALDVARAIGNNYPTGVYMVWNLTGRVQFTIACTGGGQVTTIGWFIDRPRSIGARVHGTSGFVGASATFVQRDNWRNGATWQSTYGFQGYGIFQLGGVADVVPANCSVTFGAGNVIFPWIGPDAAHTSDPRFLQVPGQPGIAGACAYYTLTNQSTVPYTATVDLDDGLAHSVAFYIVDYANEVGRDGSITAYDVTDPANPVAIDATRTIGDQHTTGIYMVWNITGHVRFDIALISGVNIVTAGWFIDRPRTVGARTHGTDSRIVDPRLISYWKLDAVGTGLTAVDLGVAGANAVDSTGNTTNPTAAPIHAPLNFANPQSRHFPGSGNGLDAGTAPSHSLTKNFTISAWARYATPASVSPILGRMDNPTTQGWCLSTISGIPSYLIGTTAGQAQLQANGPVAAGVWTHVVAVTYASSSTMFIGGRPQLNSSSSVSAVSPTMHTFVGRDYNNGLTHTLNGDLDDVRLYGVALTNDQISSLAAGNEPFLVAVTTRAHGTNSRIVGQLISWWKLDETGAGATAVDYGVALLNATDPGGTTTLATTVPVVPPRLASWDPGARTFPAGAYLTTATPAAAHSFQLNFTVSAWVRFKTTTVSQAIIGHQVATLDRGWGVGTDSTGRMYSTLCSGGFDGGLQTDPTSGIISVGVWTHLCVSYGNYIRGHYTNARKSTYTSSSSATLSADLPTQLGRDFSDTPTNTLNGDLDDVRIYNCPFTDDMVYSLYGGNDPFAVTVTPRAHSTGSWIIRPVTRTHFTSSVQQWTAARTHGTNTILPATRARTYSTNSLLRATTIRTHTTDLVRQATTVHGHSTSTLLLATAARTHGSDSLLRATTVRTYSTDIAPRATTTRTHNTDFALLATTVRTHGSSSLLRATMARTHGTDIALRATTTRPHATDLARQATLIRDHAADTGLRLPGSRGQGADAMLRPSLATFVQRDNWRNGIHWMGTYRDQGYSLFGLDNVPDSLPPQTTYGFTGATYLNPWYPVSEPADPRLLRSPNNLDATGAAVWYTDVSTPMTLTVQFDDGLAHAVSLFCVDAGRQGRRMTIEVFSADGTISLDGPQDVDDCQTTAVYMTWNVQGLVQFVITPQLDHTGVISALFFAPAMTIGGVAHGTDTFISTPVVTTHSTDILMSTPVVTTYSSDSALLATAIVPHSGDGLLRLTSTTTHAGDSFLRQSVATFVQRDNWRNGFWIGQYGAQGYSLFGIGGVADVMPPQVAYGFTNATYLNPWRAVADGGDPRFLEIPGQPGATGVAVWYIGTATSMTLTVQFSDALAHAVSLFCVDAGSQGRQQTIAAYDANGVGLLDGPRDVGDFATTSVYMSWNIQGTIQFIIDHPASHDAVVSALFIDSPLALGGQAHGTDSCVMMTSTPTVTTDIFIQAGVVASRSRSQRPGTRTLAFGD